MDLKTNLLGPMQLARGQVEQEASAAGAVAAAREALARGEQMDEYVAQLKSGRAGTGMSWNKNQKKWRAQISVGGKSYWLGAYEEKPDAAAAVAAAREVLARGEKMDEYVAQNCPKRKLADRQSSTVPGRK